ncbi:MAG: hypothetical protein U0837_16715 [Dehalococcoidia bacterium]|jgi:hypothetical protein
MVAASPRTPAQTLDWVIRESVWPALRAQGFTRTRRTFERAFSPGVTQRVAFQLLFKAGEVVLHFGVGFEVLREWFAAWRGVELDEVGAIQIGGTAAHLAPPYRFGVVPVSSVEDMIVWANEALKSLVLPELEAISTLESAIKRWEGGAPYANVYPGIYAPLARLALGDRAGAKATALRFAEHYERLRAQPDVVEEHRRLAQFVASAPAEPVGD